MLAQDVVARLRQLVSGLEQAAEQHRASGAGDRLRQRQLAACHQRRRDTGASDCERDDVFGQPGVPRREAEFALEVAEVLTNGVGEQGVVPLAVERWAVTAPGW